MSLLNHEQSLEVSRALRCVRGLLRGTRRRKFVKTARAYVGGGAVHPPRQNDVCRSVLGLVRLVADLARSREELMKVALERGRIIEDLRRTCDPAREREIFEIHDRIQPVYGEE